MLGPEDVLRIVFDESGIKNSLIWSDWVAIDSFVASLDHDFIAELKGWTEVISKETELVCTEVIDRSHQLLKT